MADEAPPDAITEAEYDALPWLHVYAQANWHGTCEIIGTRSALLELKAAIDAALETGRGVAKPVVCDGEGYEIVVARTNATGMRLTALPYLDPLASGREEEKTWPDPP